MPSTGDGHAKLKIYSYIPDYQLIYFSSDVVQSRGVLWCVVLWSTSQHDTSQSALVLSHHCFSPPTRYYFYRILWVVHYHIRHARVLAVVWLPGSRLQASLAGPGSIASFPIEENKLPAGHYHTLGEVCVHPGGASLLWAACI